MASIDTIVKEILQEAETQASSLLEEAGKKAADIRGVAEQEGKALQEETLEKAEQDAAAYEARVESQIDMKRRQSILSAKQGVITDIIGKVYDKLNSLDDAPYFAMIQKLFGRACRPQEGEILFSEKDKKRLPADLIEMLSKAASQAGGSIRLSDEPADIDNGFILRYGGIDENCSLKALFNDKQNEMQDIVNRVLW